MHGAHQSLTDACCKLHEGRRMDLSTIGKAFSRRHLVQKMREASFRAFRALTPHLKSVVIEDAAGHYVVAIAKDNFITFECVKFGEYVTSPIQQAIAFYRSLGRPEGGTFLDVGANIGTETVAALKSGAFSRGIAIEPIAENLQNLRMALCANGLSSVVQVIPAAVSSRSGVMRMRKSATNAGDHRIADGVGTGSELLEVEVTTIDQVVERCDLRQSPVGMIFIDVQGHEPDALEGAKNLLRTGIPLVMEYTPADMNRDDRAERLLRILREQYNAYVVLEQGGCQGPYGIEELTSLKQSAREHLDVFIYRRPLDV
jgi:FkbM family methyltransferase